MIGDVLHDRYRIVDKLGFGGYSTVWLAQDRQREKYVAVKVGIANSLSQEMKSLRALSALSVHPGHDAIPSPLDEFEVRGPNGVYPCYTMAPARCNLREASFSYLFPLDVARPLVGGLTMAISHMHSCGYVHRDIHLRNILVKLPSSFNHLSVEQFYEEYGELETVPITGRDGKPLPPNVPTKAVISLNLGMDADDFKLHDTHVLLSDFAESYCPSSETPEERTATHHLQHDLQKPDSNRRPLFHTRLISRVWQWRFGRYWA
ncbi:hypothetical protein PENFLA_c085G05522 [Penicillium flavigenum]|uniref:non-specific serine/threonine protein kinase n=1 Tax=Penicillium flavigenum TaxID=254877 RepID=A0A1V6S9A7_9EURO|nr:hypothetical protein PENFLA_c085G05522 [Penicillium flavigenum]